MATGTLTSAALTELCLDRIAALNPRLRAVIAVSPQAAAEAAHGISSAARATRPARCTASRC